MRHSFRNSVCVCVCVCVHVHVHVWCVRVSLCLGGLPAGFENKTQIFKAYKLLSKG